MAKSPNSTYYRRGGIVMAGLTQERLKELLRYNKVDGTFNWVVKRKGTRKDKNAGCVNSKGYYEICVDGKTFLSHRVAWLYNHGYFPENHIDHINRNRTDNRMCNLREASRQCNSINSKDNKSNTSGIKGVRFDKAARKWKSHIKIDQTNIHLGYYVDFNDAVCARLAAEQSAGWDKCDRLSNASQYVKTEIQATI